MATKKNDREQAKSRALILNDSQSWVESLTPKGRRRRSHFYFLLILLPLFLLSLFGCPLYNPAAFIEHKTDPDAISSKSTQATLQWNQPVSGGSQVVSYTVSYRLHGSSTWILLATVPASSQPSFTVLRSVVGAGDFDFAVAAVDSIGTESPLHTSLDPTANPATGWFLSW